MKKLLLSITVIMALSSCQKYELEDFEKEKPKQTQPIITPPTPIQPLPPNWCPSGTWDIYGNCLP